ncbi:MAG TPA: hypothetical protein VF062_15745 [Candidatus Limnocylindrales bacterium]
MPDNVVAQGEVPFVILRDGRTVMAHFRTTYKPQPSHSLSDEKSTRWRLTLDGRDLRVIRHKEGNENWLPMCNSWARGDKAPIRAVSKDGVDAASYDYYYLHHYGSLSGEVTLLIDPDAMTVTVDDRLEFDGD